MGGAHRLAGVIWSPASIAWTLLTAGSQRRNFRPFNIWLPLQLDRWALGEAFLHLHPPHPLSHTSTISLTHTASLAIVCHVASPLSSPFTPSLRLHPVNFLTAPSPSPLSSSLAFCHTRSLLLSLSSIAFYFHLSFRTALCLTHSPTLPLALSLRLSLALIDRFYAICVKM